MSYSKHPCIDCGKLCDYKALRCKICHGLHRRTGGIWSRVIPHYCVDCGREISPGRTFCNSCSGKRKWLAGKIQPHIRSGSDHPCWRGGRVRTVNGYITVYQPGHPRATGGNRKYVLEHILIWEQANKKPLPDGWIIHHLNGTPNDNRIVNLVALPKKKHSLVLQAKAKRIQELEALLNNQGQLL